MVDSIEYGNPTQSQVKWLSKEGLAFKFFEQLQKFAFPKNSSRVTINELNELNDYVKELSADEEKIKKYRIYDQNLISVYKYHIKSLNLQGAEEIDIFFEDIQKDINYLIYNLKYFFQRPRPHQLSKFYKQSLFPFHSISANSPSYPSCQVIQADIISYILGNWYPTHFVFFSDLCKEVEFSRLYMGLNYQSDIDFSYFITEMIKMDREFIAKYSL
jgi:hypothetical protein